MKGIDSTHMFIRMLIFPVIFWVKNEFAFIICIKY